MISVLWKYTIRPEHKVAFLAAYGSQGEWVRFFQKDEGYAGTQLLQESETEFWTIDRWNSKEEYDHFRAAYMKEYQEMDRSCDAFFDAEEYIGTFTEL